MEKEFYSISEVAKILNANYHTIQRLLQTGKIKAVDIGAGGKRKTWRISAAELNNFIQSHAKSGISPDKKAE